MWHIIKRQKMTIKILLYKIACLLIKTYLMRILKLTSNIVWYCGKCSDYHFSSRSIKYFY